MLILFFDTETNGLPKERNSVNPGDWPAIVQIAWQLLDYQNKSYPACVERKSYIIKPEETIVWSDEAAAIHGISRERALIEGLDVRKVLNEFKDAARRATVCVAHNIAFDEPIVKNACLRICMSSVDAWWPRHSYCTMKTSTLLCGIPGRHVKRPSLEPFKYPRLSELYVKLYGSEANLRFHDAGEDVACLVQCFQELMRLRRVPTYEWTLPDLRVICLF